jgi:hypothetical protein
MAGEEKMVIELDDCSKRALSAFMKNVMEMWSKILISMGL